MDSSIVRRATPWLDMPLVFSGNYREYECTLNETAQCDFQQGYWVFWYEADHRYALPTVAFFVAVIAVFTIGYVAGNILPESVQKTPFMTKIRAMLRFLSYRMVRIPVLDWNSAPVGLLFLGAVGTIFFMSMTLGPKPYYWPNTDEVDYGGSPPIATRTGWMALACMPFVFATAGKANPITFFTGVSYERLQVFHRWISYAFFVLSLVHTFPFIVYNFQTNMMADMWNGMIFYWTGVVALVAQAWLTFASFGPIRNWCYEWFKFSHFLAGLVFMLFLFFHCDATLTAWDYFVATGVLYTLSWLYRQIRIYFEHGISHRAELSLAANGFIRVGIPTKATWTVGQHFFVRFMAFGMHAWTIHPFSACSLPLEATKDSSGGSELVLFIRPRGGFTARLARYIESHPNAKVRVLLDGPYGGVDTKVIGKSQRMLVIAGGSGAGWALPFITTLKQLLGDGSAVNSGASLRVVLATRDTATTQWFEAEVRQLLDSLSTSLRQALRIELHYTGSQANKEGPTNAGPFLKELSDPENSVKLEPGPTKESPSLDTTETTPSQDSQSIQHYESRPDLPAMIREEASSVGEGQSLGVFVCGPLSMQSDVSNAVAGEQLNLAKKGAGDIHLHSEHFSWA